MYAGHRTVGQLRERGGLLLFVRRGRSRSWWQRCATASRETQQARTRTYIHSHTHIYIYAADIRRDIRVYMHFPPFLAVVGSVGRSPLAAAAARARERDTPGAFRSWSVASRPARENARSPGASPPTRLTTRHTVSHEAAYFARRARTRQTIKRRTEDTAPPFLVTKHSRRTATHGYDGGLRGARRCSAALGCRRPQGRRRTAAAPRVAQPGAVGIGAKCGFARENRSPRSRAPLLSRARHVTHRAFRARPEFLPRMVPRFAIDPGGLNLARVETHGAFVAI